MLLDQSEVKIPVSKACDYLADLNMHQFYVQQVKDNRMIEWYINNTKNQLIIQPISVIPPSQGSSSLKLLFNHDNSKQKSLSQTYLKDIGEIGCLQMGIMVLKFCELKIHPKISMLNIYKVGSRLKLLVTDSQLPQEKFVQQFIQILRQLWQDNQKLLDILNQIKQNSISQLQQLRQTLNQREQIEYSIQNLLSKQQQIKFFVHNVNLTEQQTLWILQTIKFPHYKLKQIYKGSQNGYSLQYFQAAINTKQNILYYLQSQAGKKVIFYCAVIYKEDKTAIFGNYISDPNRQSKLLSLTNKTIHNLRPNVNPKIKNNKAVGYGKQCLICIGQFDIVVSAGNLSNVCYFPISYSPDQQSLTDSAQKLIGGQNFILKELLAFQLIKPQ